MKKTRKKLQINKETLRHLSGEQMKEVEGGSIGRTWNCPTNESCTGLCKCQV